MFSVKKCLLGLGLGASVLLTGCASNQSSTPQSTVTATPQGVMCDKCQVVWVKVNDTNQKGRVIGYHMAQKMECPDCRDMVQSFLDSGKLEHTCKACGGNMTVCETHGN